MWIVLAKLGHPYSFVVLAIVIAVFVVQLVLLTRTDIFPTINIPVVCIVWTYAGILPNGMSGRVIYLYKRYLTEQIEVQSLSGYIVVKIFSQKNVDIRAALARVTAASQTVLKLLPRAGCNASALPILQWGLSNKKSSQMFDIWHRFIQQSARDHRRRSEIIAMLSTALALGESGEQNALLGRAVVSGFLIGTQTTLFFVSTVFRMPDARRLPRAAPPSFQPGSTA